ncbi:hypothetical protein F4777DRAFT_573750 [Nemania sp. FL0916]|nr:hypothetical protein F4777DRAFT_573750 [Nemania sp. FL0916]
MRLSQAHSQPPASTLLTLLATATTLTNLVGAIPYPRDSLRDHGFGYLMSQECSEYCGASNELCCAADEACYTSAGTPTCTGRAENVLAERDYTTTWTETLTFTSTVSSWYVPTTTAGVGINGADCIPPPGSGEIPCGPICCATWQYCAQSGQCSANAGYSTWTEVLTTGTYVTTQFSAPYRPTSGPTITQGPTTTNTFASASETASTTGPPALSSTNGSGLSGGAIAGIVVGTIAGIILLLLLCFCCIARGLWGIIFGGRKRRRQSERIEVTEGHYSRHGSAAAAGAGRTQHSGWFGGGRFGGGGRRPSPGTSRKEKKSSGGGLGWAFAAIGALALLLGLRRGDKRKASTHRRSRSDRSSSYIYGSYTQDSPTLVPDGGHAGRDNPGNRASREDREARGRLARRESSNSSPVVRRSCIIIF